MQNEIIKNNTHWRTIAESCSSNALQEIPYEHAARLKILPISLNTFGGEKELLIAINIGQHSPDLISELKLLTNCRILVTEIICEALEKSISTAYSKLYSRNSKNKAITAHSVETPKNVVNIIDALSSKEEKTPDILKKIISYAFLHKASDIHLKSSPEQTCKISYRINGRMECIEKVSCSNREFEYITRHIKILCTLDTTEHKKDQEGSFEFSFHDIRIRIRCSIIPTIHGNKIALRILYNYLLEEQKTSTFSPLELGLNKTQANVIHRTILSKGGIMLVSGPTGSGKSTLLYSILESYTPEHWNILSLEDPVERIINKITQVEIKSEVASHYQSAFKSMLRQDPDMLCISEIRDENVLRTALQAALSGILILSTIHASNTFELLLRLFELGASPVALGAALQFVSSQKLIPKNCIFCTEIEKIKKTTAEIFYLPEDTKIASSRGCKKCNQTKEGGLIACYETLAPNLEIVSQIHELYTHGFSEDKIRKVHQAFSRTHFQSFKSSLRNLLRERIISEEIALRYLR